MDDMSRDRANRDGSRTNGSPRRRYTRWILGGLIALIAVHYLLLGFAESIPGHQIIYLYFFAVMVMLPGLVSTGILFPGTRLYLRLMISMVLGTAHFFIFLILFSVLGLDISHISLVLPLSLAALALYYAYGSFAGFELPADQPLKRPTVVILFLLLTFVSIITLVVKDPLLYTGDSPDNIAYIRAISRSHEVFPDEFMYKDGGMLTRDIRRGLLHGMWGAINVATSRVAVHPVWPLFSWIGSIFVLLGVFCFGMLLFRNQSIAVAAVLLYFFYHQGGLAGHQLIMHAYSFNFARSFLFLFFPFVMLFLRSRRGEFLLIAAISSFAAVGTHISYIMIMPFIAFVLWSTEWVQAGRGSRSRLVTRLFPLVIGSIVILNLPYLLIRYFRDYAPANEIHTHVHGVLFFTERLAVVNPIIFFQNTGYVMGAAFFAIFILWRTSRGDRYLRSLLVLVAAVYLLVYNPLWVPLIMDRITYLIVRFFAAAPAMLVVACLLRTLWLRARGRIDSPSRPATVAGWAIVLVLLLPGLIFNFRDFAYAGKHRRESERKSCLRLRDLYSAINDEIPGGRILASDPITSYCVPAFTDQYVVCTFDQHSTPNDSTAIERIIDCRDVYLPGDSCRRITGTLEKYGAGYVVLNGRIPRTVRSQYWGVDRDLAESAARELSGCGDLFERIYSRESLYLFEFAEIPALDAAAATVVPEERRRFAIGDFTGDYDTLTHSGTEGIYIAGWEKEDVRVSRGDTLRIRVDWVAGAPVEPGTYVIYVRFDTDYDKGPLYGDAWGKVYRKVIEELRGERYRFRIDALPFGGVYPPDLWARGELLRQHIDVPVPRDISEGRYTVSVKLHDAPHYSNLRMSDLLRNEDFYDGPDLMRVKID